MNWLTLHHGRVRAVIAALVVLTLVPCTQVLHADDSLSVTVTPPLFQLTIGPGEKWASTIKIVNNNSYDVTYYAQVMNFQADGENGSSKFTPIIDETPEDRSMSLAQWIQISSDGIPVASHTSRDVPFTVDIPEGAEPGGHYAAILIGTQPPATTGGNTMKVSSYVSSLLFVRIKGDVLESGRIREFSTDKALYQTPTANFTVRFENTGNTHLQPQGDIEIFNMWGKERGKLDINQKSNFGNVLPKSIRKFNFSWQGEESVFDIGRYSAVVTLGYGDEGKQNASAVTYFWVVPIVPVAGTLGVFLLFILLMTWFIRRYIRQALAISLARAPVTSVPHIPAIPRSAPLVERRVPIMKAMIEPLREGVIDLRNVRNTKKIEVAMPQETPRSVALSPLTLGQFMRKYMLFFVFILVVIMGAAGAWWYFDKALTPKRSFQISDVTIHEEAVSSSTTATQ